MASLTPTDVLDAAVLADLAYRPDSANLAIGLLNAGWTPIVTDTPSNGQPGYLYNNLNAGAFASQKQNSNTLAISFTGTGGYLLPDLLTDFSLGTTDWTSYYRLYDSFFAQIASFLSANTLIDKILVTGHSLGGAMVEYFLNQFAASDSRIVGVTFGSPGVAYDLSTLGDRILRIEHSDDPVVDAYLWDHGPELDLQVSRPEATALTQLTFAEHQMANYADTARTVFGSPFAQEILDNADSYFVTIAPDSSGVVYGSAGNDAVFGGDYNDTIYAGDSRDLLDGGLGQDKIFGEAGNDNLHGGAHDDTLYGGAGDDELSGDNGADYLKGETDNDRLDGGSGNDDIYGDQGDDLLIGNSGVDTLHGGQGADTFSFSAADLPQLQSSLLIDVIRDYNQGDTGSYSSAEGDVIDISGIVGAAYLAGEPISELYKLERSPVDGLLRLFVNQDGRGIAFGWEAIAVLENVPNGAVVNVKVDPNGGVTPIPAPSAPGSWIISPSAQSVDENGGSISFTITRTDTRADETVYISTTVDHGSANQNDYTPWLNVPVTIPAGQSQYVVQIAITNNSTSEVPETFGLIVQSSPSQPASQYLASGSFTILDDDAVGSSGSFTTGSDTVWITPPAGTSSHDGLTGNDTAVVDLSAWTGGTYTTAIGVTQTFESGAQSVSFANVENFIVLGGSGNDNIATSDGNDGIFGGAGDDTLSGGAGINVLDGGSGNDTFNGVGNSEIISGGSGIDTLSLNRAASTQNEVIHVDALNGGAFTLSDGTVVSGIEIVYIQTGSGDDTATFTNMAAAQQYFYAGGGIDFVSLDYSGASQAVNFTYYPGGHFGFSELNDGSGRVSMYDTEAFDVIGGSGNDYFVASGAPGVAAGRVSFHGNAGDDLFDVEAVAADVLDGGSGIDELRLDFSGSTQNEVIHIDALNGSAFTLSDGTVVSGIEVVDIQTGSGDDTATFTNLTDYLETFHGGGGFDFASVDYSGASQGIYFNYDGLYHEAYTSTGAGLVQMLETEAFDITGGSGNDYFVASGANGVGGARVSFHGNAGDDRFDVDSSSAADVLDGGSGIDTLYLSRAGSTQNEVIHVDALNGGAFTLSDGTVVSGIEIIDIQTGSGDDTATFTNIIGMTSADQTFNAGSGFDFASVDYSGASQWVNFFYDGVYHSGLSTLGGVSGRVYMNDTEAFDITGGSGNDYFDATGAARVSFHGNAGDDYLGGTSGTDSLFGGSGNDTLVGDSGNDTIDGGAGLDIALINGVRSGYTISAASGITTVTDINLADGDTGTDTFTTVETLRFNDQDFVVVLPVTVTVNLTSGNDIYVATTFDNYVVNGLAGNDSITTDTGNDTITGGTGNDTISSGAGNDTIRYGTGNNGFDAVDGGAGSNDRIVATAAGVTIGLASLTGVEAIDAAGFANVKILGSTAANLLDFSGVTLTGIASIDAGAGNDTVIGSGGNDVIIAGSGNDMLSGGGGDDLFKVGASAGTDVYDGGSGNDRIEASANNVTLTVTGTNLAGIETISAGGFTGFKLIGTSANNTLDFSGVTLAGVSRIGGGSGNDVIIGSAAGDVIEGGAGRDVLTGGLGADVFDFNLTSHSKGSANIDRITDFVQGQDHIDLSSIDANLGLAGNDAFIFINSAAFSGVAGQLRFDTTSIAGVTRILADTDGNSTVDMEIHLTGTYNLTAGDFLL